MEGRKGGCFVAGVVTAAAVLLVASWMFGEFVLAPVHCSSPVCDVWRTQLILSHVSSFVGLGGLMLAGSNKRPDLLLPISAMILGLTALTGIPNPGLYILVGVDALLVLGVIVWFVLWRPGH